VLKRALKPSDLRNLLAHGHWWKLDPEERWIEVRREKLRRGQKRFERITVREIDSASIELMEVQAALSNSRSTIERGPFRRLKGYRSVISLSFDLW
jgi:hypothetical protein